jgi:hypothetical protein
MTRPTPHPPASGAAWTGDHPAGGGDVGRRCGLFGRVEPAAWLISDPQGGRLATCEADLDDILLNDALSPVRPDNRVRMEVWRA